MTTKVVNIAYEVIVDEEAQTVIDGLVYEFCGVTGMTEEQCRILVDVIIDTGFKSNHALDLQDQLHIAQMFLDMFATRLGVRAPF